MFDYIRYRQRLRRLDRMREKIIEDGDAIIYKMHREGASADKIEEERSGLAHEFWLVEQEYRDLASSRLVYTAARLFVPRPPIPQSQSNMGNEQWEYGDKIDRWYLTDHGMTELRERIRQEQRGQREIRLAYLGAGAQIITAITGLGSVLIDLVVSVWQYPHRSGIKKRWQLESCPPSLEIQRFAPSDRHRVPTIFM